MYPLVVAVVMMCFFRERGSVWTFAAIGMSIVGAVLLSLGNVDFSHGDTTLGIVSATVSVVAYGGYIVGVRRSRAVEIDSTVLTCCVMAFGALFFIAGGLLTGGVRLETDPHNGSISSVWPFRRRPSRTWRWCRPSRASGRR